MTYITHKVFAVWAVTLAHMILWYNGIGEVNYYLAWIIMLYAGKSGALFPDVDHNWNSVKEKTMVNKMINAFIHATGGTHRSWQTHSWDIALVFTLISFILPPQLVRMGAISQVNGAILSLLLVGFAIGWISHLFSDMLSSAGVRIFCFRPTTLAFVPKQLFGFRFNTGNAWEGFIYKLTKKINIIFGFIGMVLPMLFTPQGTQALANIGIHIPR